MFVHNTEEVIESDEYGKAVFSCEASFIFRNLTASLTHSLTDWWRVSSCSILQHPLSRSYSSRTIKGNQGNIWSSRESRVTGEPRGIQGI